MKMVTAPVEMVMVLSPPLALERKNLESSVKRSPNKLSKHIQAAKDKEFSSYLESVSVFLSHYYYYCYYVTIIIIILLFLPSY